MSEEILTVSLLVEAGEAKPTGSIAPTLGPTGVNIGQVIADINKETMNFKGMKIPVKVVVTKKTRTYTLEVGIPPASALVMKEAGIEKGSGTPQDRDGGNITYKQVLTITQTKRENLLASSLKTGSLEILGTMQSMGVTCENEDPRDVQKRVKNGDFDDVIAEFEQN